MSNSAIFYGDCFEYSQKALASKQMDEKAIVALMLEIDGKTMDEVKTILAASLAKLSGETGAVIAEISAAVDVSKVEAVIEEISAAVDVPKIEAVVLEVRDAFRKVEEVATRCGWCVPKTSCS